MSTEQAWPPPQPEPVRKMIQHLGEVWADAGPLKFEVFTRTVVRVIGGKPARGLDARVVSDAKA